MSSVPFPLTDKSTISNWLFSMTPPNTKSIIKPFTCNIDTITSKSSFLVNVLIWEIFNNSGSFKSSSKPDWTTFTLLSISSKLIDPSEKSLQRSDLPLQFLDTYDFKLELLDIVWDASLFFLNSCLNYQNWRLLLGFEENFHMKKCLKHY